VRERKQELDHAKRSGVEFDRKAATPLLEGQWKVVFCEKPAAANPHVHQSWHQSLPEALAAFALLSKRRCLNRIALLATINGEGNNAG
jgi:hypothetical protein